MPENATPEDERQNEQPKQGEKGNPPNRDSGVLAAQQEDLQELARAIVREAGLQQNPEREARLQQNPEREARLEANKLRIEAAKTQLLISSGLLVGMAAVVGVLPTSNRLYYLLAAVVLVGISVFFALFYMEIIATEVETQSSTRRSSGGRVNVFPLLWGPLNLGLGLFAFGMYVFYNIPLGEPGPGRGGFFADNPVFSRWSSDPVALFLAVYSSIVLTLLVMLVIYPLISGFISPRISARVRRRPVDGASEERESPQTVEQEPERAGPRPDAPGAQEGAQRPWWRRMFRG